MRKNALAVAAGCLCLCSVHAAETLHVYLIGNSLTMSLRQERLHRLFEERGIDYQFGSQLSGGKSLFRHWNYKQEPGQKWTCWETSIPDGDTFEPDPNHYDKDPAWRFGRYDTALARHTWDKVVFQIYGGSLHDDMAAIRGFIDLALKNKTADTFYVYSTWPSRPRKRGPDDKPLKEAENIDYTALWEADYTSTIDDTSKLSRQNYATRDYAATLVDALNSTYPSLPTKIRMIPGGEVLAELDKAIKANQLPGLDALIRRSPSHVPGVDADTGTDDGVNILYADSVHLNPMPHQAPTLGVFAVASTLFAMLAEQSPVGLPGSIYELDDAADAALIKAVQELVWRVVQSHPHTGL